MWVAMGKDQSCARTLLITDGSFGASALAQVTETFQRVNIRQAKCSSASDREKVLAIIESSYASLKAFDLHVSKLLLKQCARRQSSSMSRSLSEDVLSSAGFDASHLASLRNHSTGSFIDTKGSFREDGPRGSSFREQRSRNVSFEHVDFPEQQPQGSLVV